MKQNGQIIQNAVNTINLPTLPNSNNLPTFKIPNIDPPNTAWLSEWLTKMEQIRYNVLNNIKTKSNVD